MMKNDRVLVVMACCGFMVMAGCQRAEEPIAPPPTEEAAEAEAEPEAEKPAAEAEKAAPEKK
jgi:hypothetical protein